MKYTAYQNRQNTDVLFTPADGYASFSGYVSDSIAHIEAEQLLDPALWALFVEQFRIGNVDDHDKGWRGEYWGKTMRGACFTYSYTQNEKLYKILEDTVRDMMTVQDKYGRISTYSIPAEFHGWDIWSRKYVLLGFQYFLEICRDDGLADQIIACMCRSADYLVAKIGNDEVGKLPITYTSEWWNGLNASSILEPFVRLYNLTGQQRYLDFAKKIIDAGGMRGFNMFEAALDDKLCPYEYPITKAYEMISNFEGIIEYYRVTGEEKYKDMAVKFGRRVIESDITVIGSAGTTHELFDHSIVRQFDPKFNGIMQETCVTVTWMKYCFQLLLLTGDPIWADQIERSVYNALIGAINFENHICRGQVFAFDSYSPLFNGWRGRAVGGFKDIIRKRFYWGCCVSIGAAGTGLIAMTAVTSSKNGAAVNLYMPGDTVTSLPEGCTLKLHFETDYPINGGVKITVDTDAVAPFAIMLRIPSWSAETILTVNGEKIAASAGEYAVIERDWKSGDIIELDFDMRCRIIRADSIDPNADAESICHAAIQRGPVMLARDSQFGEDIKEAVELVDNEGFAVLEPSDTGAIKCKQEWKVKTTDGYITVADYPSVGQNWDEKMPVTVWITTK
ncbi:MAG: hypothetical protein GX628_02835 [Clostridiales bacterium]|nr:hypothetical protein [Clostridiales bacterium]